MKTRKIVLLSTCCVLLVISILQLVFKNNDKVRNFNTKETLDKIVIHTPQEDFSVYSEGENWFVLTEKGSEPAKEIMAEGLTEALKSIKALDKVAVKNEKNSVQYELTEEKMITVQAYSKNKLIRTLEIGKAATANSQCFICVDSKNDIYLASGNLISKFNKTSTDFVEVIEENIQES